MDAHAVHVATGYKGTTPFPIVHFVEWVLPIVYNDFELMIESPEELGDVFGETYPCQHVMKLREDIYDKAVAGDGFARMTIAHEVGHLLEHDDTPLAMTRRAANSQTPAYLSSEWQANAFAGALLMPACKIVDMDEFAVADTYRVSLAAATTQKQKIREEAARWSLPRL